jgi:hypothetical protein
MGDDGQEQFEDYEEQLDDVDEVRLGVARLAACLASAGVWPSGSTLC